MLAVGFEIAAWISYGEGDKLYTDDPAYSNHRNMVAAGHVMAGLFAVASGASFYLWHRDKKRAARGASLYIIPSRGGASVGGGFRF